MNELETLLVKGVKKGVSQEPLYFIRYTSRSFISHLLLTIIIIEGVIVITENFQRKSHYVTFIGSEGLTFRGSLLSLVTRVFVPLVEVQF